MIVQTNSDAIARLCELYTIVALQRMDLMGNQPDGAKGGNEQALRQHLGRMVGTDDIPQFSADVMIHMPPAD